ncbi:MAG: AAA domain-containing protein [Planctomycetota bacterium]
MRSSNDETRAIRLVEYLTRLASLRTKTVRELSEDSQVLWIHKVPRRKGCFTQAWGANEEYDRDIWLEVQSYREPELPRPPEICQHWINNDTIRDTKDLPVLLETITEQIKNPGWKEGLDQPQYINQTIYLENCHRVREEWNKYVEQKWLPWAEQHKEWEEVHEVYSTLFAIHQEQLRLGEEYELVLGLGLLTWQTPSRQRVRRHLVVANALLEFEARLGKFTVRPNPDGASLRPELDMLDVEEQPARAEDSAKKGLMQAEDDPWNKDCVEGVLKALVHSMNTLGEYHDRMTTEAPQYSEKPTVEYAPAVILRKRSIRGLTEVLKRIKKRLEEDDVIPAEFRDIAEIKVNQNNDLSEENDVADTDFGGEIYFPKPFNEEQRRIIEKIRSSNGVLVQGPPGTGKSHTIANLICHLLATGKRILITAKTPRALKVLEGHVPEEIRPLCINMLGSGIEERKALETSVNSILQKNEESNLFENAQKGIQKGEDDLHRLRQEKAEITNRLRAIRESETHSQTVADGAYRGTAAQIARELQSDDNKYGWFTDDVALGCEFPISETELYKLLNGLRALTDDKKKELGESWPDLNSILNVEQFELLVEGERKAIELENTLSIDIDTAFFQSVSELSGERIRYLLDGLNQLTCEIQRIKAMPHRWASDAIWDVSSGNCAVWEELSKFSTKTISDLTNIVEKSDSTNITLPEKAEIRAVYEDALAIKNHLSHGGKLGWGPFCPSVVKPIRHIIRSVRVNGRPCNSLERITLLVDTLRVRIELEDAWVFWGGRIERPTGPYILQFRLFVALTDTLSDILSLEDQFNQCKNILQRCRNTLQAVWHEEPCLRLLARTCDYALSKIQRTQAQNELKKEESWIASWTTKSSAHALTGQLLEAIQSRNINAFACGCAKIEELGQLRKSASWVDEALQKVEQVAPDLANNLSVSCRDAMWDERIKMLSDAWRWAQARTWLRKYICKEDAPSLERREHQIESEINRIIAHIASLKAWSFCFSRMREHHRRHMENWRLMMSQITKGGRGKHDNWRREQAQKSLGECREAVPAWVMPLHRVWDTVDPSPGMFDVVIVDEASQCGFEAVPLFYLGKKVLIVGDNKQISPNAMGVPENAVHHLMEQFLYDFNFKGSFGLNISLFDHAKRLFGTQRVALREHFRCMPEIIRFSNDLCYSDTPLIPLRQYGADRLEPVKHIYLDNGYREGYGNRVINRVEAEAIVNKIVELCRDDRYVGKTMGVIVLQGNAQAALIERQLLECLDAEEIDRRRLICGNPYSFQGDERDIIFLSMVAAPNERIGAMARDTFERSFNVAASRAKDQMWLFHSVTQNDLAETCLRKRLLKHFEETQIQEIAGIAVDNLRRQSERANRSIEKPPHPFDSWFEVDVALEVAGRGYRVIPQLEVAGKFIDIVIEGGQCRLAVECYGDYWHGAEQYEQDMERQRKLERCGWVFYIVRESAFYANKEVVLTGLWRLLEERGISPQDWIPSEDVPLEKEQDGQSPNAEKVEVGDTVIYVNDEEPDVEKQALITLGSSHPDYGEINVNTPIAQALLGASVGDVVTVKLPNSIAHLRIIEIRKRDVY